MTSITFYRDDDDKYFGFECMGHAGFSIFGKDIVCAAISTLTINFVNSVDELTDAECDVVSDSKTGSMSVTIKDYNNDEIQLLFKSLRLGLNAIQAEYPKYLKLTNRR